MLDSARRILEQSRLEVPRLVTGCSAKAAGASFWKRSASGCSSPAPWTLVETGGWPCGFTVSKTAVSPVTTWSFCVTTTEPLASSRRIDELPPGPGVADCIDPDFGPFGAAGAGVAGAAGPES